MQLRAEFIQRKMLPGKACKLCARFWFSCECMVSFPEIGLQLLDQKYLQGDGVEIALLWLNRSGVRRKCSAATCEKWSPGLFKT